jgi:hypothetical protein
MKELTRPEHIGASQRIPGADPVVGAAGRRDGMKPYGGPVNHPRRGRASPATPLTIAKRVASVLAAILLFAVADASVATPRAQMIQALVRPGMTPRQVVQAVGSRSGLLETQDCLAEPPADCRVIRMAVRGPLLASYVLEAVMGSDGRLERVIQTGPTWVGAWER